MCSWERLSCAAAGQAQQQQRDAQAALQSYECAATLGRQALRSAPGPASASGSSERRAECRSAPAPAGDVVGSGGRGDRGARAAADQVPMRSPDPDPGPGRNPGQYARPAGRAPALQVAVRALLAQAALLRAQGLGASAGAAEDEALALDPFAQNGTFELRRARAAEVNCDPRVKTPAAAAGE